MGDVDIEKIPPLKIRELTNVEPLKIRELTNVEPLRIGQVAPAAIHVKEVNHVDPISVESLKIDQVRNLDPVRVERFDVTYLPTVNVSLSRMPTLDLNVRRVPPVAIAVNQDFCLPSQYTVHAKLLGIEVMRLNVHGHTMVSPRHRVPREHSRAHSRSFPDVAALGQAGIPVTRTERWTLKKSARVPPSPARTLGQLFRAVGQRVARTAAPSMLHRAASHRPAAPGAVRLGSPRFSYGITGPSSQAGGSLSFGQH